MDTSPRGPLAILKKPVLLFIALSLLASAVNYLLYPTLGRLLPEAQYTDITLALSLFTQITTFLSSIIAITIGVLKEAKSADEGKKIINILQMFLFRSFVILSAALLVLSPLLLPLVDTPGLFAVPISLMMVLSIPITIALGYLNGKNLMKEAGIVMALSSILQFGIVSASALLTHSGVVAMTSASIAQVLTLIIIYALYKKHALPSMASLFSIEKSPYPSSIRKLIYYTAWSSFAIMAISILQTADLLIIKSMQTNIKLYTDIYVVSRVVFFAGMILIWPFLGELSIGEHRKNRKKLHRLFSWFIVIAVGAELVVIVVGQKLFEIMFGYHYAVSDYLLLTSLSIAYKFLLLIATAITLYFIVHRRYFGVVFALSFSALTLSSGLLLVREGSVATILMALCLSSLVGVFFAYYKIFLLAMHDK